MDLARDLLSECQGNLLNLYEIGYEQLLERRGIGPVKATQLKAIAELSKRIARTGRGYHLSMNCPSSIADSSRLLYGRTPAPQGRGFYGSFL